MDQGVRPCVVMFSVVMDELCKKGKLDEANRWLELMIQTGADPDIYTYNILIKGIALQRSISKQRFVRNSSAVNWEFDKACEPVLFLWSLIIGRFALQGFLTFRSLLVLFVKLFNDILCRNLNSNSFSGPIPASIGNLTKLVLLDLTDNQLNKTIPVFNETYLDWMD
ncbi:pentatricopeptide repeat-containing protein At3g22470, mitochondrial-like [Pistacia vera]|uniref:pentatricopeptide repeat-containing protein At3g22470, mitochondrial-like n=1 Tax=Pistacia vera TaxID=55513 RepID=UPI001263D7CE|nr:pentatricopeptide repeat-containing protein At3g22470, mitochondrial-like [Pistacia vera]